MGKPFRTLDRPTLDFLRCMIVHEHNQETEDMNRDIHDFYSSNRMTQEVKDKRIAIVNKLRKYLMASKELKEELGDIKINGLTAFGSFPTQCATNESDLDLCICASTNQKKAKTLVATVLRAVNKDLYTNPNLRSHFKDTEIRDIVFISTAKVPIIKFKIDGVPVDLSATFETNPPRTSLAAKYINAYCQLDDRFAVLVTTLKVWLKSEGSAEDHQRDFPNSYSLILLLIHVLQWFDVLPNLIETHPEKFAVKHFTDWALCDMTTQSFNRPLTENDVKIHSMRPTSSLTVVDLLHLFAAHYSKRNLLTDCRFNMKNGEIEDRCGDQSSIKITDNYDPRNPARSARSSGEFADALNELCRVIKAPVSNKFELMMRITKEKTYFHRDPDFLFGAYPEEIRRQQRERQREQETRMLRNQQQHLQQQYRHSLPQYRPPQHLHQPFQHQVPLMPYVPPHMRHQVAPNGMFPHMNFQQNMHSMHYMPPFPQPNYFGPPSGPPFDPHSRTNNWLNKR